MTIELTPAVQRVVAAINAGDTEAFVAAFTDDGMVDDWGRILTGRDGVRSWAATDAIGQNASIEVVAAENVGQTTTINFDWSSDRFNGRSSAIVTERDGLVQSFRIPPHE